VLGGIGNIKGAVVEPLHGRGGKPGDRLWRSHLERRPAFGIWILILVVKPAGLFGKYQPEKV